MGELWKQHAPGTESYICRHPEKSLHNRLHGRSNTWRPSKRRTDLP